MGDRVVDCARLESVCAERHRGFESLPIRQHADKICRVCGLALCNRITEIRTPFDRWGALRARAKSEALKLEPKRSFGLSLPIRQPSLGAKQKRKRLPRRSEMKAGFSL